MNRGLFPALATLTAALFVLSMLVGPAGFGGLSALWGDAGDPMTIILQEIRLPRTILGAFVGAGLGVTGAAMQGYLRNPLAEPGLIGVSATAALGAVLAIHSGLAASFALALPLAALVGSMTGVAIVLVLAGPRGGSITLILAGIALSSLAAALTSLTLNLAPNPWAANEIVFWMMGSLADRSMAHVWLAVPLIAIGIVILLTLGRSLDALTLGEDTAATMGVNLGRVRLTLVVATAFVIGAGTAVAGAIGFVGLVVPHLLRPLVGARPSTLLFASGFGGAIMVLAADIAVRVVLPQGDLKLGVLTAIVGAPLFLHLIYKTRRAQG